MRPVVGEISVWDAAGETEAKFWIFLVAAK